MRFVLPILLVLPLVTSAHAAMDTGSDLLRACELTTQSSDTLLSSAQAIEAGWCFGLVYGFIYLDRARGSTVQWCVPVRVTVGEGVRVLLKFMNDNPKLLIWDPIAVAAVAFEFSFPCND